MLLGVPEYGMVGTYRSIAVVFVGFLVGHLEGFATE